MQVLGWVLGKRHVWGGAVSSHDYRWGADLGGVTSQVVYITYARATGLKAKHFYTCTSRATMESAKYEHKRLARVI